MSVDVNLTTFDFSDVLRKARARCRFSVRQLSANSGVSSSLISALENGRRAAGHLTLKKLAKALRLRGAEHVSFIKLGSHTSLRHRLEPGSERKGQQLLERLACAIAGIKPNVIKDVFLEYNDGNSGIHYDCVIRTITNDFYAVEINSKAIAVYHIPSKNGRSPDFRIIRDMHPTKIIKL